MRRLPRTTSFGRALLCALLMGAAPAAGQTQPPIHGVTGTVATDATVRAEGEAGHAIAEGVGKVVDGAKKICRAPRARRRTRWKDCSRGTASSCETQRTARAAP